MIRPVVALLVLLCSWNSQDAFAQYRDLDEITLLGLESITITELRRELRQQVEIVEALHPKVSDNTFQYRLKSAVQRGLHGSGYLDATVAWVSDSNSTPSLQIHEGHRFRWGHLTLSGAGSQSHQKIHDFLIAVRPNPDKDDLLWNPGKPATGSLFSRLSLQRQLQDQLSKLGLHGNDAKVNFQRQNASRTVDVEIRLSDKDSFATVDLPTSSQDVADSVPIGTLLVDGQLSELDKIFHRYFEKPLRGIVVQIEDDDTKLRMGFGRTESWVEAKRVANNHLLAAARLRVNQDILVAASAPTRKSWRFPVADLALTIQEKSIDEAENGKCSHFYFEAGFSTKEQNSAKPRGFQFTRRAWQDWFPPQLTKRTVTDHQVHFQYGDHRMTLDREGNLIELSGIDPNNRHLNVIMVSDQKVEKLGAQIIDARSARDLIVRSADGSESDLISILRNHFYAAEDSNIQIAPANGTADLGGRLVLSFLNDEQLYPKESLVSKIATITALQLTGYQNTIPERLDEIEQQALTSPIAAAAIGEIALRAKLLDRSHEYFSAASNLIYIDGALDRDLELLFSDDSLLGQVAENFEVKELLLAVQQFASSKNQPIPTVLNTLVLAMPENSIREQRRKNVILAVKVMLQTQYQDSFLQVCEAKLNQIERTKIRIANKAKDKQRK